MDLSEALEDTRGPNELLGNLFHANILFNAEETAAYLCDLADQGL
jgi:hypothetical protein